REMSVPRKFRASQRSTNRPTPANSTRRCLRHHRDLRVPLVIPCPFAGPKLTPEVHPIRKRQGLGPGQAFRGVVISPVNRFSWTTRASDHALCLQAAEGSSSIASSVNREQSVGSG